MTIRKARVVSGKRPKKRKGKRSIRPKRKGSGLIAVVHASTGETTTVGRTAKKPLP